MHTHDTETAQKLLRAFMLFKKTTWHDRTVGGYKPSEVRTLFCIKKGLRPDAPELKVSEISKMLQVTAPTMTQMVKNLEASGLIERKMDPADRRAVAITLTEKGEHVTQQAADEFQHSFNGLIGHLGEERSNQLAELLTEAAHYFTERALSQQAQRSGDYMYD